MCYNYTSSLYDRLKKSVIIISSEIRQPIGKFVFAQAGYYRFNSFIRVVSGNFQFKSPIECFEEHDRDSNT